MNQKNYQKELELILKQEQGRSVASLLLHSCCAPCSSYVLEYLSAYFCITVFYYNPNIYPPQEFQRRAEEQKMLIAQLKTKHPVCFLQGAYESEKFYTIAAGLEQEAEQGKRCLNCYALRLRETAQMAVKKNMDYFCTTLSISPHKDAQALNQIGARIAQQYGVAYLFSDFKKKGGYQRSVQLSKDYGLYRQDYCGCQYSKAQREGEHIYEPNKDTENCAQHGG